MRHFALRTDEIQRSVVAALRDIGVTVNIVNLPFDLAVSGLDSSGKRQLCYMEVKNTKTGYGRKGMKDGGNANQKSWIEKNPNAPVFFVDTPEVAIAVWQEFAK